MDRPGRRLDTWPTNHAEAAKGTKQTRQRRERPKKQKDYVGISEQDNESISNKTKINNWKTLWECKNVLT